MTHHVPHTQLAQLTIVATVLGRRILNQPDAKKYTSTYITLLIYSCVRQSMYPVSEHVFAPLHNIWKLNLATLLCHCLEFLNIFVFCINLSIISHHVDHMPILSIFSWFTYKLSIMALWYTNGFILLHIVLYLTQDISIKVESVWIKSHYRSSMLKRIIMLMRLWREIKHE